MRVVTPGAIIHPTALISKENNFLAALCGSSEGLGLAVVDVSTGEFTLAEFGGEQAGRRAADELQRLMPRDCSSPRLLGVHAPTFPGIEGRHGGHPPGRLAV